MDEMGKQVKELRKAAKWFEDACFPDGAKLVTEAADTIEALSAKLAVENSGGWIACEDRLPEEPFGCLVTIIDSNPMTLEEFENVLPYHVGYDGNQWHDMEGEQIPFDVIAWQPLSEPYRP